MTVPFKILLVDDERTMRYCFQRLLEEEGYLVETAKDGDEALRKFGACKPDLVLLDVMMPKKNGLATCVALRDLDAIVPIIFFTAAPSEITLVRGLGAGANDYIAKDCSPEELLARIGAAIARSEAALMSAPNAGSRRMLGDAVLDFSLMIVEREGQVEPLTRSEAIVLRALTDTANRFLSTDEILELLYGPNHLADDKVVSSLIRRLRTKLGRVGNLIVSRRGLGYKVVN